jgi:hypothetical protein
MGTPFNGYGTFDHMATNVLDALLKQTPTRLPNLPKVGGIYMLYDHTGKAKYIGMTSPEKGFYDRIYKRHRSGSEDRHKYSSYYNVGRMWRDRDNAQDCLDSKTSKKLRNKFIEKYCSAAYVEIELSKLELRALEDKVIKIAPMEVKPWNSNQMEVRLLDEPIELVDIIIAELNFSKSQVDAINRQGKLEKTRNS